MKKVIYLFFVCTLFCGCGTNTEQQPVHKTDCFTAGFASESLKLDDNETYYIAGYHNGEEPCGILDEQRVQTVWLEAGGNSLLLVSVDCIALGGATVQDVRERLSSFCKETGCDSVNVVPTHTHAGVDTLGLWGPVGLDGKNEAFMEQLISAAVRTAKAAYENKEKGQLMYSKTIVSDLQEDSREPQVYDEYLYQFRFEPEDETKNGIRILSFAAHAEALRGDNRLVSRDYPGVVSDVIKESTGDDVIFLPGAIGGLIMTRELVEDDAETNLRLTGERLAAYVLSPKMECVLKPEITISCVEFHADLDNTLFIYYKFLGILGNRVMRKISGGYALQSELTVLQIGNVTLALLPGEVFPELVEGTTCEDDPEGLRDIADRYGKEELVIVGLANDEIGYVVPPSDYVLDGALPFIQKAEGEHYEETNSVGRECAHALAEAFEQAVR